MSNNPRFLSLELPPIGGRVTLDPEQSAHCARVLRLQNGESIILINGQGTLGKATIVNSHPRNTQVEVVELQTASVRSEAHLVFGITKPPALETIFKKCTELGVSSFQPLVTAHSLHPSSWNSERWKKIIVEASKQCQELWFPNLLEPLSFSDWLTQRNTSSPLVFCDENERTGSVDKKLQGPVEILIGPEGGWSQEERQKLLQASVIHLGLGKNRLRAETACLVALTLTKLQLGEL